ncbi:hypothetical protein BST27_20325, partial [Mycobacterium intermedium]
MELAWEPMREPDVESVWKTLLRPIASEMRTGAVELAELAVTRVQAEMPMLFPDPQSVRENVVSTAASIRQLADIIDVAGDPRGVELPAPTAALARAGVQRQIPLASLMRFYRVTHELLWQWVWDRITTAAIGQKQQADALRLVSSWMFGYVDAALNRAEQAYEAERESWLRNTAAARTDAIDDILAQRERDPQRASKRLRYDVNRHHVGVVAWVDAIPESGDAQSVLSEALTILGREMGGETTLIHPAGSLAAFGWISRQSTFATIAFASVADGAGGPELPDGVRVGIGEAGHGLQGFRSTHLEASSARRVASLAGTRAGALTRYRDVAIPALASCDAEQAASFVL